MTRTERQPEEESCFTQGTPSNIGTVPSRRFVPAAVVIDHSVDELRDRRERLAAERGSITSLPIRFPRATLHRGIQVSPDWLSAATWQTARQVHTTITDAGVRWAGLSDVVDVSRPNRTYVSSRTGLPHWSSGHPAGVPVRGPPDRIAHRACCSRSARSGWLGLRCSYSLNRRESRRRFSGADRRTRLG